MSLFLCICCKSKSCAWVGVSGVCPQSFLVITEYNQKVTLLQTVDVLWSTLYGHWPQAKGVSLVWYLICYTKIQSSEVVQLKQNLEGRRYPSRSRTTRLGERTHCPPFFPMRPMPVKLGPLLITILISTLVEQHFVSARFHHYNIVWSLLHEWFLFNLKTVSWPFHRATVKR